MERRFETQIVKDWMKQRGKGAREELAYKIGLSSSYVDKMVRDGSPLPRVDMAQAMANVLGVGFDELFPARKTEDSAA